MLRGVAAGGPLVANYGEYNFNVAAKENEGNDFGGALDQFFKKMDEAAPAVASDPPACSDSCRTVALLHISDMLHAC